MPLTAAPTSHVYVLKNSDQQKVSVDYFYSVLSAALDITANEYGKTKILTKDFPYSQNRSLQLLDDPNGIDILHTMTNKERESKYVAINIPLLKGLMGYRRLLTNSNNLFTIETIRSLSELSSKIACQGTHWPDSDILEHNSLTVARVLIFEAMYKMTAKGRCDYFPRGIHEVKTELDKFSQQHSNLRVAKNLMLHYPTAMYFFVGKRNKELADRMSEGLHLLITNGQLEKMLLSSDIIKPLLPLSQWDSTYILELDNPFFSDVAHQQSRLSLGKPSPSS